MQNAVDQPDQRGWRLGFPESWAGHQLRYHDLLPFSPEVKKSNVIGKNNTPGDSESTRPATEVANELGFGLVCIPGTLNLSIH